MTELQQLAEATAWLAVLAWCALALLLVGVLVEIIGRIGK